MIDAKQLKINQDNNLEQDFNPHGYDKIPHHSSRIFDGGTETQEITARNLICQSLEKRLGKKVIPESALLKRNWPFKYNCTMDDIKSGKAVVR
jgi:hypothetical protein